MSDARISPLSPADIRQRENMKADVHGQTELVHCRTAARGEGARVRVREETWRGKGGHAMVWVGDKVPSREIDPKTAKKIRKVLGLD